MVVKGKKQIPNYLLEKGVINNKNFLNAFFKKSY
jgi:hypothetical protein